MTVISVEIWPYGDSSNSSLIGELHIGNDGSGDEWVGNYKYELFYEVKEIFKGHVKNHRRPDGVWKLVELCLRDYGKKIRKPLGNSGGKSKTRGRRKSN